MFDRSRYAHAGVDIDKADQIKARLKALAQKTYGPSVLGGIGGFGGLFLLGELATPDTVLVGSTDGVGTKLKLAFACGRHDTVGQDLVNHLINDILCCGARPLFFFDYIGLGALDEEVVCQIASGIAKACAENGLALLGGETAQLPEFYRAGEYDLAGFIVGWVRKDAVIDGRAIKPGNIILGLSSNGLHTNGYTLARKAFFEHGGLKMGDLIAETNTEVYEELMRVHRCYLKGILPLLDRGLLNGLAHITGGGFYGNLIRILPPDVTAVIETKRWPVPGVFRAIQRLADVSDHEMYRVFNMGVGMVLFCDESNVNEVSEALEDIGTFRIGYCTSGPRKVVVTA